MWPSKVREGDLLSESLISGSQAESCMGLNYSLGWSPFILFDPNAVKHVAGPVVIPIFGANDID